MVNCVFLSILSSLKCWVCKAVILFASEDSIFIMFKKPLPEELSSWSTLRIYVYVECI